jgi:RNA polymerase sigma-70 factor (ECF subfamily)
MESQPEITIPSAEIVANEEALRRCELFVAEKQSLTRMARRLTGDDEDARDLVQEVELRIFLHPTGPRDEDSFRAWCQGILRNRVSQFRRSAARHHRSQHVGLDKLEDRSDGRFEGLYDGVEARRFFDQFSGLEERELEILVRRFVLEETSTEIASELESSPAAIRMKLKRLLQRLRAGLTALGVWLGSATELMADATKMLLPLA